MQKIIIKFHEQLWLKCSIVIVNNKKDFLNENILLTVAIKKQQTPIKRHLSFLPCVEYD